ncbi:MAG: hypothetical protein EXR07_11025 [Acetobacteraceae bacterium]|nr:hypothetical protein [Acetobacteraceae bacterium]
MLSPARARAYLACGSIVTAPLMHAAFVNPRFVIPAIGAGMAQACLAAWLLAVRWRSGRWAAPVVAGTVVLAIGLWASHLSIGIWSGLAHTGVFLTLLALFAGSLRPGYTPIVTAIARAARGPLPPELVRYTRTVTWLWAGFAAAQILVSMLLLAFAPPSIWSLFVNGLDMPAMLILFGGEYAYRRYRFTELPRLSPAQIRSAFVAYVSTREPG